jgi:hypothetical protein
VYGFREHADDGRSDKLGAPRLWSDFLHDLRGSYRDRNRPIADFEAGGAAAIEADKMEAVLADFPTSKGWSMEQFAAVRTREIYRSPNGDRWLLARDPDIGRVFVRGGQPPALRSELFSSRLVMDQRSIPAAELGRPPDLTVGRTRLRPSEP